MTPRILAAFFLPNAFGDAYVYIRDIGTMSTKLRSGAFGLGDLYGFWLPLFQFLSALINVFVGNGFYSGKVVSALFGGAVCLLVYLVTLQLTAHRTASLLAFLLIALNPLHIFYSASAMTDVPHAFFILASLYFCLRQRWILAAAFAALAGLTRMESWMFIALIPTIQFLKERRISIIALLILLVPPLFWFYVSWKATGNWRTCFSARQQYHDWLLAANPTLAHFSWAHILRDGAMLLVSTDVAVMIAAFVAGWFVIKKIATAARFPNRAARALPNGQANAPIAVSDDATAITPPVIFFFGFLALIVVAYLTGTQPIIFPRYGLILFTLGTPLLAGTYLRLSKQTPQLTRALLISVIVICGLDASVELAGSIGLLNQISAQRVVADYLHANFKPDLAGRIFCDDGTVQVMSGIATERFLISPDAPHDREGFVSYLKDQRVVLLVITGNEDSTPAKLFPELRDGTTTDAFEQVAQSSTGFPPMEIWVYRVRDKDASQNRER
jgi:hypothetical protein